MCEVGWVVGEFTQDLDCCEWIDRAVVVNSPTTALANTMALTADLV